MDTQETIGTTTDDTATGAVTQENTIQEEAAKTFTQQEMNEIIAKRVAKVKSSYDGIDPNEYRELKSLQSQVEDENLIKRQDFDQLMKKHKTRSDTEISSLRGELERIKIDGALIDAASQLKSIAPEQTAKLLREQVKLDADGKVVIMDGENIRYNDDSEPMTVSQLVEDFLTANTYFKSAGPSGTDSTSNTTVKDNNNVTLADLDMNRPEHRDIYRKWKQEGKV
tara:strand:+ start:180 stop:854 length:675 start_codon:yes stop_codon:yes gene_type:complete